MRLVDGLVDPGRFGQFGWSGPAGEAFGVLGVGLVEGDLALGADLLGGAEVHRGWGVHPDPGVPVFVVVGHEEPVAERAGVFE